MTDLYPNGCDENLLYRYLDGDLDAGETAQVAAHVAGCRQCHRQVAALAAFSQNLRDRVHHASESVDFVALEKQVLNTVLRQSRSRGGLSRFIASLKYIVPATVTAGLVLFFTFSNEVLQPPPAPSAIINSFTGSMSSVMIFETPETRQTILWYTEETDVESEPNAV
ncbi:MAG: zf-HC2 domain-containing protein [Desulfobacteraceae bacterium]|jgi:anti-sigma factor RsiW|nr:zf-HC2 domain-containing protein [Desulfobacteraceae bacterium]